LQDKNRTGPAARLEARIQRWLSRTDKFRADLAQYEATRSRAVAPKKYKGASDPPTPLKRARSPEVEPEEVSNEHVAWCFVHVEGVF
jgi:hypothetical protein